MALEKLLEVENAIAPLFEHLDFIIEAFDEATRIVLTSAFAISLLHFQDGFDSTPISRGYHYHP